MNQFKGNVVDGCNFAVIFDIFVKMSNVFGKGSPDSRHISQSHLCVHNSKLGNTEFVLPSCMNDFSYNSYQTQVSGMEHFYLEI